MLQDAEGFRQQKIAVAVGEAESFLAIPQAIDRSFPDNTGQIPIVAKVLSAD